MMTRRTNAAQTQENRSFDPEPTYRVISVDAAAGTQTIEHCQTKNTYAVTVTQLTGVE